MDRVREGLLLVPYTRTRLRYVRLGYGGRRRSDEVGRVGKAAEFFLHCLGEDCKGHVRVSQHTPDNGGR